jgi:hypothetical protein
VNRDIKFFDPATRRVDVHGILSLMDAWSRRWHGRAPGGHGGGRELIDLMAALHLANFTLWHMEDRVRQEDLPDADIAELKRSIDRENQIRNELIEEIDVNFHEALIGSGETLPAAVCHTESPAMILDRLSILSLRSYHLEEELAQEDMPAERRALRSLKLEQVKLLRDGLVSSAQIFLDEIAEGKRTFFIARELKLYNDPSTSPRLRKPGAR